MNPSASALNLALCQYLGWQGDPLATLAGAVMTDPGFILGHTTIAALNCLGGVVGSAPPVQDPLAAAQGCANSAAITMTQRETLHLAAARAWADGEIEAAATHWETAVAADPRDLLALRLAHDTHFFLGASAKLRDIPLAALPAYDGEPERGYVLGMAAFGLEEMGDYATAERAGREAVDINPADAWAVHAVAHVLEMQDRTEEGAAWLHELAPHWTPAAGLAVHNWWHAALFEIELHNAARALQIYDASIGAGATPMVLDLVDASSLLWRLELAGQDVGARWANLAALWRPYVEDHVLAFNDVHIAMAFAGAGDAAGLDRLTQSVAEYAARETGTNARISRDFGLPLIRALPAFRRGDLAATVSIMAPLYRVLAPVGGSNAQRDVFIQTLGLAALRSGNEILAKDIASEREKLKIGTPLSWKRQALVY